MRKRKRPDWLVLVYKYWIKPIGKLPEELWQTANLMQATWNALVALREETGKNIREKEPLSVEEKRAEWVIFDERAKTLTKESGLHWDCQEEILDRFQKACKNKQAPKRHNKLKHLSIPHRFTKGGKEPVKVFSKKSELFSLFPIKETAYANNKQESRRLRITKGNFSIGETKIGFIVNLHRELPKHSFIKKVHLIGLNKKLLGWQWAIAITVELFPPEIQTVLPNRVCAIHLDPKEFDKYLRIAVLVDSEGRTIEFRLPFDASTAETRRYNQKYKQNPIIDDWRELEEAQKKIDLLLEQLKAKLKKLLPTQVAQLAKMGQGHLIRLLYQLERSNLAPECQAEIKIWRKVNNGLRRRIRVAKDRFLARRRWIYQNIAIWIAENYCEINLGPKLITQSETQEEKENPSESYKDFVAIGEFRKNLQTACKKTGANLLTSQTKNAHSKCHVCLGKIDMGAANMICICENGHEIDSSVNAALNLLSEIDFKFRNTKEIQNNTDAKTFPDQMKRFMVDAKKN